MNDVSASLMHADRGLQGLLVLMQACPPGTRLDVVQLATLLAPLADQVAQAAAAVEVLHSG